MAHSIRRAAAFPRVSPSVTLSTLLLSFWLFPILIPKTAGEQSAPLEPRIQWTASRLSGSPEPPPPYTVERLYTNLVVHSPIYIAPEPGAGHLILVDRLPGEPTRWQARRFFNHPSTSASETLLVLTNSQIYGLTFHPNYASNGYLYVFHNANRTNRITRFTAATEPHRPAPVRPNSELTIIQWHSAGHDGGDLAFDRDGMLFISSGDGTSDSDTWVSGQDMTRLLGGVLRIDVDGAPPGQTYRVPEDNPFWHIPGARPEKWAYGLRNPWRLSFDLASGQLWVGNNGQDLWETAHLVRRGENYGWSVYEGSHPFYINRPRGPTPIVLPTIEHSHAEFRSLTGGVVYRGDRLSELDGVYIYGDYSTGRIWGARHDGDRVTWRAELADTSLQIASFRVDQFGRLLIVDHAGGIYQLRRAPAAATSAPFPRLLSETGLFSDTRAHALQPGVLPYTVNAPGWADGAEAERFLALPPETKINYSSGRGWDFPNGAVLVQTLSLPGASPSNPAPRRVETRVLLRQQGEWAGYSYRWNEEETDAALVESGGASATFEVHDPSANLITSQSWRFPSRAECMMCHSRAVNYVLGASEAQMNVDLDHQGTRMNQLRTLERLGLFASALPQPPEKLPKLVNPYDPDQPLELRARSYLHANCSVCHVEAGGGNAQMELGFATALNNMRLLGARPQHDSFGVHNAMLVTPGDPESSVLTHRLSRRGRGQMPPLVTAKVDDRAVQLFRDWIRQLKPEREFVQEWTLADLLPALESVSSQRSFKKGQAAFRDVGCAQCHRFGTEGGSVGPDLSGIAQRLPMRDVLESILEPSKVIAPAYALTIVETRDGETIVGRIERENDDELAIRADLFASAAQIVSKKNIQHRALSSVSNMPNGTVNVLREPEILDLLAYLLSNGDPNHGAFSKE